MPEPIDIARQLQLHLESLRAAGVLFVPRGKPLKIAATATATFAPGPAPSPPADPLAERRHELTLLAAEVAKCDRCPDLFSTRTQTVFGVGPIDPDVAFCGEVPGADEDRQGEPFVGRAGQLLTRIINASGFQREEVFIFNTLKCRPPGNRTPTLEECTNCRPYFERQFDLIRPKHLVALGGTAAKALCKPRPASPACAARSTSIAACPSSARSTPPALLRDDSGKMKRDVWEDMKLLLRTMGRPIPEVKKN